MFGKFLMGRGIEIKVNVNVCHTFDITVSSGP